MTVDRAGIRERRRQLPPAERARAADAVAEGVRRVVGHAARLGAYVAVGGELDPAPLVAWAWRRGIGVWLPRVTDELTLVFAEHTPDVGLVPGRFAVPVPPPEAATLAARDLDVVLVPLVAFDRCGTRAGTGAGFYDRTLEFCLGTPADARPLLVGLAYAWQEQAVVERRPWDVPLDVVVTECEVIRPDSW
jgi:5-formyltetrahydrofolate cyclo-ligase